MPFKQKQGFQNKRFKVGILYNLPTKPPRGEAQDFMAEAEVEDQVTAVQDALERLDFEYQLFPLKDDLIGFIKVLKLSKPDVVVNLCESVFGDSHLEMHVPSILELLRIPYTGSSPLTLGLRLNKGLAKTIFKSNGIPTPEYQVLSSFKEWKGDINYPLFVKPLMEDASVGISRKKSYVRNDVELKSQVEYINKLYKQPALVEKYIPGREFNVAILGNEEPEILPISEIVFGFSEEPKVVDYAAKWFTGSDEDLKTTPVCPAKISQYIKNKLEKVAIAAYKAIYCRDYARVDIRLNGEHPFVLEVNPNPDISHEAGFARALKAAGISFEDFVKKLILFALERKT
jgi:D-alanine-D-alanine ligase